MKKYVRLNGTRIVGWLETDAPAAPSPDWVEAPDWPGPQARPAPGWAPHIVGGAVTWVDERADHEQMARAWAAVREKRDNLLRASDWRPVLAADRGGQAMAAWNSSPWRSYRQALRDVTDQADPFNITWPAPPP